METKPQPDQRVLAWDGERWVRAIWVAKHSKEQVYDEGDWCDYNEADDTDYWPEGWYEVQTHGGDEKFWHLPNGATAWQKMPPPPGANPSPPANPPNCARVLRKEEEMVALLESIAMPTVLIDGVEYVPKASVHELTDERMRKCLELLTEIQYFHGSTHKHRRWAWSAMEALSPELAQLAANDPRAAYELVHC